MKTNDEGGGQLLVYADKLCELAGAFGLGCLVSAYAGVGTVAAWIILGIAVAAKIIIHAL